MLLEVLKILNVFKSVYNENGVRNENKEDSIKKENVFFLKC